MHNITPSLQKRSVPSWLTWAWRIGPLRRAWLVLERIPPFAASAFSINGLGSADGRTLVWGKVRRIFLSMVPPLSRFLQKKYRLDGDCNRCGTSCKLLFKCPHWDDGSKLCSVYEDRPNICRLFPITPSDIRERN